MLTTLEIPLVEERFVKLEAIATRYGVTSETLLQMAIDEFISRPEQNVADVMQYVLHKNAELYRRLA